MMALSKYSTVGLGNMNKYESQVQAKKKKPFLSLEVPLLEFAITKLSLKSLVYKWLYDDG